jgi:hypothetical protein
MLVVSCLGRTVTRADLDALQHAGSDAGRGRGLLVYSAGCALSVVATLRVNVHADAAA